MAPLFDVFLSHNSQDKPIVREIWKMLRERGIRPWLDEEELIPGRDWQEDLEEIVRTVPAAAVFVGQDGTRGWLRSVGSMTTPVESSSRSGSWSRISGASTICMAMPGSG